LQHRCKLSLDLFWLADPSIEDSRTLPEPDVLAREIVDDLQAAQEQFEAILLKLPPAG
jgi:type I restriction enzyme M protein